MKISQDINPERTIILIGLYCNLIFSYLAIYTVENPPSAKIISPLM